MGVLGRPLWIGSGSRRAYTAPVGGITYTDGFSGLTKEQMQDLAFAVSDNADIVRTSTDEVWYHGPGGVHRRISVGDVYGPFEITATDSAAGTTTTQTCSFRLMGFNHSSLITGTSAGYGRTTATGKAGLLFQMTSLWADRKRGSNYRNGSLSQGPMAVFLNGGFYSALPFASVVQDVYATIGGFRYVSVPSYKQVTGVTRTWEGYDRYGAQSRWYATHNTASDRILRTPDNNARSWITSTWVYETSDNYDFYAVIPPDGVLETPLTEPDREMVGNYHYFAPVFNI